MGVVAPPVRVTAHALARCCERVACMDWRRAEALIRQGLAAPIAWRATRWGEAAATAYGLQVGHWRCIALVVDEGAARVVVTVTPATRGSSGAGRPRTRGAQLTWTRSTWTRMV